MPKAPPSPRRSSRARTTQPASGSSNSSNSSTSGHGERSTRSALQSTPQKASTPHSQSASDDQLDTATNPPTRRSRRQQETVSSEVMPKREDANEHEDEIIEDEETTRCICGLDDYPGPPVTESSTKGSKPPSATVATVADPDGQSDEPGSMFIQCDTCEVWQHGGCVGIMDESAAPDSYFCEQCRPEFHQLMKNATGQRYSRYLPILGKISKSQRKPSVPKDWEARSVRESAKTPTEPAKRRSTMNSRATFEEEEMLRKVLEESKQDGHINTSEISIARKGKRGREESEDVRSDIKRQRTNSSEPPSSRSNAESARHHSEQAEDSRKKASRSALTSKHRDKELRDKELVRAEAASKRNGRAERRRADDSEVADEKPTIEENATEDIVEGSTINAEDPPASTPTNNTTLPTSTSTSKRHAASRKRGRGGRLAGMAPRDADPDAPSPAKNGKADSPKEIIRDGAGSGADSNIGVNNNIVQTNGVRRGRPGRDKHDGQVREPSMAELKRRAAAMLEFISRSQKEMADAEQRRLRPVMNGTSGGISTGAAGLADELATRLVKWQQEFTEEAATAEAHS